MFSSGIRDIQQAKHSRLDEIFSAAAAAATAAR